jgi:hypothetical protein
MGNIKRFSRFMLASLGLLVLIGSCLAEQIEISENHDEIQKDVAQDFDHLNRHGIMMGPMNGPPNGIIFHDWQGFALKNNESQILRISIEGVRPVRPMGVRKLLAMNMTLDEVKKEILAEEGNAIYRGHLRLEETTYWLVGIEVIHDEDSLSMRSDIIEAQSRSASNNPIESIGSIKVITSMIQDSSKGDGMLILNRGSQIGSYKIFVDMLH